MARLTIGIAAAGVTALLLSLGTFLQALDARQVEGHHGLRFSMLLTLLRRPRWLAGTIIGYLAFPFQLVALAHAPLVVVQPIHAGGLLLLLIAGVVFLDEPMGRADIAGAAAIVVGLVLVAWGAPGGSDSPRDQALFATVVAVTLVLSLAPYPIRSRCGRVVLMMSAALGYTSANLATKGISDAMARGHWGVAVGYLAAAAVGSVGGVLSQMTAFQRHRAIEVLPLTSAIPIFLPALLGLFLLHIHWGTAALAGAPFAVGSAVLITGTLVLARSQAVIDISERAR